MLRIVVAISALPIALSCASTQAGEGAVRRGRLLTDQGRYPEAHRVLDAAASKAEQAPAPSLGRAMAFYALGDLYHQSSDLDGPEGAWRWLSRAAEEYAAVLGARHPSVGLVLARQAEVLRERGDRDGADRLDQQALAIFRESLPANHPVRAFQAAGQPILVHPDEIAAVAFAPGADMRDPVETQSTGSAPAASGARTSLISNSEPAVVDDTGTYLKPNITLDDGTPGYAHVTEADMPWIVAIGYPREGAKYASREMTRRSAIAAMQMWEEAIQPHLPWFKLAFVEDDPHAPVQIEWKRRINGPWAGFGGMSLGRLGDVVRIGGRMEISTTPGRFNRLSADEISLLVAHEFGHILGLGHCLDCDSAMNYSWHTKERVIVTDLDVQTFLALVRCENFKTCSRGSGLGGR
ncbi:MAG: tetratricopeptide repeat protein [bacterium]|nr:tetratricopeptide repeat protein [bacterium]